VVSAGRPAPRFSAGLPQALPLTEPSLLVRFAARAEELGFEGLWTIDSAAGGPTAAQPVLDAVQALTYVASATENIRLGTAVLVLPRRNPVLLARELASLDQLSAGRVIVGVGRGQDDDTVGALGFPADRPFARLTEGVAVMRAAWSEGATTHAGELWSFDGLQIEPKPLQRPGPPIWFGAGGPKMLQRVAQVADGWVGAGSSSADDVAAQVEILDAALRSEGRDPDAFPRAKRVYIGVGEGSSAERFASALDGLYETPGLAQRIGVFGTEAECAETLRKLLAAGVGELILTPVHDYLDQLERLAAVVGRVRGE
jgi:probable F420-dependent oxidoreductase